jgi:serine/threonine-protein kinase RsbW
MANATFAGEFRNLELISDFVTKAAEEAGMDETGIYSIQLAVDEACANIIEHAYGGEGKGNINITIKSSKNELTVIIQDHGQKFNPEVIPSPKMNLPLEEISPRGLGVYLMQKMMDVVSYEFTQENGNILTMVKRK